MAVATEKKNISFGYLSRCSDGIVRLLETAFHKLGLVIGTYPWITIAISVTIATCCSVGMLRFYQESRNEKLWVPYGSDVLQHQELVEEHFPTENRFEIYIVEADNVLTPSVLQLMLELHNEVLDITVGDDNWESLCYRHGSTCFATSLLELWSFEAAVINNLNQDAILDKVNEPNLVNPVYFSPVDIDSLLGEITRDSNNRTIEARAATMIWALKQNGQPGQGEGVFGDPIDPLSEDWEDQFFEVADKFQAQDLTIYKYTPKALNDEAAEIINADSLLLAAGYTLVIVYIMVAMSKLTRLEHKVYVSLTGLMTIGLSLISSMGLASAVGQPYGPVHSMLPFLLLGIGVDDMFVLVTSWYNLTEEERKFDIREQVAIALKHSGVSITVTSVTDFFAFAIGSTTILPAMRSFCIYSGIGIIFLFFFSVTFFLPWLVIDHRRFKQRRDACCCCVIYGEEYEPSNCGRRNYLKEFFFNLYSPTLLNNIFVKILVIFITFGLLGVCMWGTITWEEDFDFHWLLPTDGEIRAYFGAREKYFPSSGDPTAIYLDTVDYYEERQAMNDLYSRFKYSKWIQASSVSSWYDSYQRWLNATKAGDPGLNTDNWPQDETLFYDWLDVFLASPEGLRFNKDINFTADPGLGERIMISRTTADTIVLQGSRQEIAALDDLVAISKNANFKAGKDAAFAHSEQFIFYASNKVIGQELLRNLGLAAACVFVMVLILLVNLWQTVIISCCVIFTLIDLSGTLNFWGVTIETTVAILLIVAIGLAVDYSVHIGHTFLIYSGSRNARTRATLGAIGPAVFNGGFSTFLAFLILSGSNSYLFLTFFKVFFLVVLYGLFHGLVFLPVILSLIGPSPYPTAKPVEPSVDLPTSHKASSKEIAQNIVVDTEDHNEKRISAVYNPAFVRDSNTGLRRVPASISNSLIIQSQSHKEKQLGSWFVHRPYQHSQHSQYQLDQQRRQPHPSLHQGTTSASIRKTNPGIHQTGPLAALHSS